MQFGGIGAEFAAADAQRLFGVDMRFVAVVEIRRVVDFVGKVKLFQHCGASVMPWSDPYADAATAMQDYPPVYPVPRIQILPANSPPPGAARIVAA